MNISNESLHDKSGCYLTFMTTGENTLSQGRIDDFKAIYPSRNGGRKALYNADYALAKMGIPQLTHDEIEYLIDIIYQAQTPRPRCTYTNPKTPYKGDFKC